jgi:modulator of FtsH protease
MIANIFMAIPALQLAIAAGFILLMSAFILFQTSQMIHGGETNYIFATYGLYLSIFNIFISLLQILGVLSADD